MKYDEFSAKLDVMMVEFRRVNGREMTSIRELKAFLNRQLVKPKTKGAKKLGALFG